jgi:hypothetical protein
MKGDVTVYLREGHYELNSPLTFGPEDSGQNGFKVVYRAYGEENPVVSGGNGSPDGRATKTESIRPAWVICFSGNSTPGNAA